MRVKVGWNTEFGRDKFDVYVDEDDLRRILHDNGLDVEKALEKINSPQAFEILKREAQMLSEYAKLDLLEKDSAPWKSAVAKMNKYLGLRNEQILLLKSKLDG
jgi:hypothetical protein